MKSSFSRRSGNGLQASVLATAMAVAAMLSGNVLAAGPSNDWAPGRLIVMPRAGLSTDALTKIVRPHGGTATRVGKSDLHIVQLSGNASETAVLAQLAHNPHLKFAELDRRVGLAFVSNDPYLGSQWHLGKINAGSAWDTAQGAGVTIAILDTGVLATHTDLNQVAGWNFVDNNSNTSDVHGHGTSVAGAAAAVVNNGMGVAGVAGGARVMPIRVADATGYAYFSTIASGVTYAADKGVRVVNVSLSGSYSSAAIQSAGNYLKSKGGLLVVGAGNSASNDGSPATSSMIPVSATDGNDALASFSSFGNYVAVAAPGVGIWTTSIDGTYRSASGTSYASPVTAGVVALMMAANPALAASQVESLLYSTAVDLGAAGRDLYFGYGRVNASAAVLAASTAKAADTQPPTVAISAPLGGGSVSGAVAVDVSAADNVGVVKVALLVNGATVAVDTVAPYQFSWDSASVANGSANLMAVAYDAAGNSRTSTTVAVNVANNVAIDTTPPTVAILNPGNNSKITGTVSVTVSAVDNAGATGLQQFLFLDGKLVASGTGGKLSYSWNTRKATSGAHQLQAIAQDAAGNRATSSISVTK